jgi:hypothetical protein
MVAVRPRILDGQHRLTAVRLTLDLPVENRLWARLIDFLKRDAAREVDRALWRLVASEAGLSRADARRAHLSLLRLMMGVVRSARRVTSTGITSGDLAHACTQLSGGFTTTAPPAMAA